MSRNLKLDGMVMVVAVAVVMAAGAAWAGSPINQSRPLDPTGSVEIENVAGSVEVVAWSEARVEITGTLSDDAEKLEVEGSARRLRIRVEEQGHGRRMRPTELVVKVPTGASVDVETVSADIAVRGVAGALGLESVSGRIEVEGTPSRLEATTVSNRISIAVAPDGSRLESVSGDVEVARVEGRLDASNVSGEIRLEGGRLDGGDLESVSGAIRCELDAVTGSLDVETMSGDIVLALPQDLAADFEVSTFSGRIANAFGPAAERTSRYTPGQELSFSTGSGGARIGLTTFSGSVELEKR